MAIFGAGESGIGAALLAVKLDYDVILWDDYKIKPEVKASLDSLEIPYGEGLGEKIFEEHVDLVIKSPGVPNGSRSVRFARANGVKLISEIEFGFLHYNGKVIAITGSNGKTTTSGLFFHLLHSSGVDAMIGGNYGTSFCRLLAQRQPEVMVLEVSSFQLDDVDTFSPDMAVLLNITPDHLDRYDYLLDRYAAAKMKIATHLGVNDLFVVNGDDETIQRQMNDRKYTCKVSKIHRSDYVDQVMSLDGSPFEMTLQGRHNRFNAMAAIIAAREMGLTESQIAEGLKTFANQAHRLENCGMVDDVTYVNDSKATNVDAVWYALDAVAAPIVWIAGGADKGNDYSQLDELVKDKVSALVCMGVDNSKLMNHFGGICQTYSTGCITDAIQQAKLLAGKGATVLLSPACASFDLFTNYMDRGDQFRSEVERLRSKEEKE